MAIHKQPGRSGRPSTSKMPAAKPATQRQLRAPTGGHPAQRGSGRSAPAAQSNQTLIIGGAAGGVVILIVIAVFAMSGGDKEKRGKEPAAPAAVEKKPVDVRELVDKGMKSGAEGYSIIKSCEGEMKSQGQGLNDAQKRELKKKLQNAVDLIAKAGQYLEEASRISGKTEGDYRSEWGQARKAANNFIPNLGP